MIDRDGFRPNVGIVLCNDEGRVFWARRIHQTGWQFPQGGIRGGEHPRDAMYRELYEEVGLETEHVWELGRTRGWLRYRLPRRYLRRGRGPVCVGQKQVWFLLRLTVDERHIDLARSPSPEFDRWRWVDWWTPPREVIHFKRRVYERALQELAPLAFPDDGPPPRPRQESGPSPSARRR